MKVSKNGEEGSISGGEMGTSKLLEGMITK
jgi:hypothetical protein